MAVREKHHGQLVCLTCLRVAGVERLIKPICVREMRNVIWPPATTPTLYLCQRYCRLLIGRYSTCQDKAEHTDAGGQLHSSNICCRDRQPSGQRSMVARVSKAVDMRYKKAQLQVMGLPSPTSSPGVISQLNHDLPAVSIVIVLVWDQIISSRPSAVLAAAGNA